MDIVVVGTGHKETPLAMREKAAFINRTIKEGIAKLKKEPSIAEVIILSTCNRSEIYAATTDPEAAIACLRNFYLTEKSPELEPYLFDYQGRDTVLHLYRVVTGLDSMILGEDQILGQAKDALDKSRDEGGAGKYLTKAFREAVTFAKKMKTEYKISETPLSLSSTAVKHVKRTFPDTYQDKKVMIIGSGQMGLLALRYMAAEGFKHVTMTNRTFHPGDEYRDIYEGVNVVQYTDRYEAMEDIDVVITATASPHTVIREGEMPDREKPLLLIDLALPRDVEPAVGEMNMVTLITIDDFKHLIDEKMQYRIKVAGQIASLIEDEIDGLMLWITKAQVDNLVGALNEQARHLADETVEILNKRYHMTGKDYDYLEKIIRSGFRKMVMPPIHKLKSLDNDNDIMRLEKSMAFLLDEEA